MEKRNKQSDQNSSPTKQPFDQLGCTGVTSSYTFDQPGTSGTIRRDLITSESFEHSCLKKRRQLIGVESNEKQQENKVFSRKDKLLKNSYLFNAIRESGTQEEKVKRVQKYLDDGADIDYLDRNDGDNTCLHVAVLENEPEIARILLKKGATIDAKNADYESPLDIAKRLGNFTIIHILETAFSANQKINVNSEFTSHQESQINMDSNEIKQTVNKPEEVVTYMKQIKQQSNKKYRKQGLHGDIYQLKLLMLFLKRGLDEGYCFRLATEKKEAKKFDDLVFEITNKDNTKEYHLLQAKHKEDESKKITFDELLTECDSDYSLAKYFFSYTDSKKEVLFKKGIIKDVTVCTNINFDLDKKYNGKVNIMEMIEKVENRDYILHIVKKASNNEPVCYRFNKNIIPLLKPVLKNYNLYRLAKRLVECCLKNNPIQHHNKNDIFKPYHTILAREVISTDKKVFFEEFINGSNTLSREARLLREFIEVEIKKQSEELSLKIVSYNIAIRKIGKAKNDKSNQKFGLNLSKGFGIGGESNWPNDASSGEDINDFIDHLVFAVNQPNEEQLGEIIENEISKEFNFSAKNYVYNELLVKMLDWLKGKGEEFISNEDGKKFFDDVKTKLCELEITGVIRKCKFKMKEHNINFKLDATQDIQLREFLTSKLPHKQIFNVITKRNTLSSIKTYQIINSTAAYEKDNSYIFINLHSVHCLQDHLIRAFGGNYDLLVINCKHSERNMDELFSLLSDIICHSNNKKIILISRENDSLASEFKNNSRTKDKYEEMTDDSIQFFHLTSESQKNFLKTSKIIFQGKEVSLCTLIDEELNYLIGEELLSKIINNETVEVGKVPYDLYEVLRFFMHRTFRIFDSNSNVREGDVSDESFSYSLLDISDLIRDEYNSLCERNDELLGEHSSDFFRLYSFQNEETFRNKTPKFKVKTDSIIVLADEPGSGKSTVLTYLAEKMKKFNDSLWVEKINLNDHSKSLNEAEFNDTVKVVDFLLDSVDLQTPLEKELFKHRIYKEGKIVFLFDGFDEICPDYKRKVIALLKLLKDTKVDRIWVTTRPHMRRELEDKLNIILYTLEPLSTKAQKEYLIKYFNQSLKTANEKSLGFVYTHVLLDLVSKSFLIKDRDFTSIPLHLRMLAEAFQDNFKEYCDSNQKTLTLPQRLDLINLYELFIKNKFYTYCKEKDKADLSKPCIKETYRKLYPSFILEHKLAGSVALFKIQDISILVSEEEKKQIDDFLRNVREGRERTGIISYVIDDRPRFIHQTYAEYFVVEFISDKLKSYPFNENLWNFLVSKILMEDNQSIRNLFDHKLSNDGDLAGLSSQIGCRKIMSEVLLHNTFERVLSVAVNESLENVVIYLLKSVEGNKSTDFIRTVFYHAVLYLVDNDRNIALELLSKCENDVDNGIKLEHTYSNDYILPSYLDIEEKNLRIFNIFLRFIENSGKIVLLIKLLDIFLTKVQETHKLHFVTFIIPYVVKKYYYAIKSINDVLERIDSRDIKSIINAKFGDGKSILHLVCDSAANCRPYNLGLVECLIKDGANVDAQDDFGMTSLHIAVAAYNGQNVVQCLINNRADIKIADKNGKTPLHLSAQYGKLEELKYLVEKGADIKTVDNDGTTVLHQAVENRLLKSAQKLICGGEGISRYNNALRDTLEMVKYIVEKESDINAVDNYGRNALHHALKIQRLKVSDFVIHKGLRRSKLDYKHHHKNHILSASKYQVGIGCNFYNSYLNFKHAHKNHKLGILQNLVAEYDDKSTDDNDFISDDDDDDDDEKYFRYWDTQSGILKVLKPLLRVRAELEAGNLEIIALSMDAVNHALEVAQNRINGSDLDVDNFQWAPRSSAFEVVKYLVEKGANFKAVDNDGTTLLHLAVVNRIFEVVQYLVDKGADLNTTKDNQTPLDWAAQSKHLEIVANLLEKGADFADEDETAVDWVALCGNLEIVTYLLQKGANFYSVDNREAFYLRVKKCISGLLIYLLSKGYILNTTDTCFKPFLQ